MQARFSLLRKTLAANQIHFTLDGRPRFKAEDILTFKAGCRIEPYCAFLVGADLWQMGAFSYAWSTLPTNTVVGRYCSIAQGVSALGFRHPIERISSSSFTYDKDFIIFSNALKKEKGLFQTQTIPPEESRITIHNDVWIGANAVLKPGITIGDGAVIAANAIVVKDVPAFSVHGGNPAKQIKWRFPREIIDKIQSSAWWKYKFTDFEELNFSDPVAFVERLGERIGRSEISEYQPSGITLNGSLTPSHATKP